MTDSQKAAIKAAMKEWLDAEKQLVEWVDGFFLDGGRVVTPENSITTNEFIAAASEKKAAYDDAWRAAGY